MGRKKELKKEIKTEESNLVIDERKIITWSKGKYKNPIKESMSRKLVESRRDKLKKLYSELKELED